MSIRNYPESVLEVLDDKFRFRPAALRAVRQFARSHPWRGSTEDRMEKFRTLNHDLAAAYEMIEPGLTCCTIDGSSSGASHYVQSEHRIVFVGKLSVVTFLHEFAHARGKDERGACRWSINLFRRCFPKWFGWLLHQGHTLVRPQDVVPRQSTEE